MPDLAMDRLRSLAAARNDEFDVGGSLGASVLSAISVAQIHTLLNPSHAELRDWASDPEKVEAAKQGLGAALALELAASGLISLAFKDWIPGAVSGSLSLALFFLGQEALKSPIENVGEAR